MKFGLIRASLLRAEDGSAWAHHGICFCGAHELNDLTCKAHRKVDCT